MLTKTNKIDQLKIEDITSLTPMQEGMLFHYLKDPGSDYYFEQLSLRISGEVDCRCFEQAWNIVIQANEMLRTVFRWEKLEKPSRIILKEHSCEPRFLDLSDKGSSQKETILKEIKNKDRGEAFDLHKVPFRLILCKLGQTQYEMVISYHHLLFDGWSTGIILKEFFNAYRQLSKGETISPSAKPEFKVFVKWINHQNTAKQGHFWRNYLKELNIKPGEIKAPIYKKKQKNWETSNTSNKRFQFPSELENKLGTFIKNHNITMASMLYSAWGILLQKYHAVSDIIFNATVSGRNNSAGIKGIENMVGLFINTLPLRIQTIPDETVSTFLSRTYLMLREWTEFENSSIFQVRDMLAKYWQETLFDSVVVFENYPLDSLAAAETAPLSIQAFSIIERTLYDLTVIITILDKLELNITYNNDLFDKTSISRLTDQFILILEKMIMYPEKTISEINIWKEEEREKFLEHIRSAWEKRSTTETEYIAPCGELEEKLVKIWAEVLNINKDMIGIDHNFFDFGGHSLKASQLVSRFHPEFGVRIPLGEIFNRPTIRKLAEYIRKAIKLEYIPMPAAEVKDYYEVSPGQRRLYMLWQLNPDSTAYNGPWSLMLKGPINIERLEHSFQKLIRRHEMLRTSFALRNGEPVQRIHEDLAKDTLPQHGQTQPPGGGSLLKLEKLGDRQEKTEVTENTDVKVQHSAFSIQHFIHKFIRPFDLSKVPLLRVGLLNVEVNEHILVVDMHHIVTDGTSSAILTGELSRLYGEEELPPLKIQYKDFSQWQNHRIEGGQLKKQEAYWLDHLSGELPVLNLPIDYPRPAVQRFEGERISFESDEVLTGRLYILMKETGTTLYMVLLSILNILLGWYSGLEDIIIGSPIAGRNHADIQDTVGFFLETLAIRNRPAAGKSFMEFLEEVKRTTLNAYENGDYPFSLLIKHLLPMNMNDLSRNPLFDVMLNVLNQPGTNFELKGVTVLPFELDIKIAKLDMTLEVIEQNGKIKFEVEYCTALFKKQTIERFIRHFFNIIRETVFDTGIRLGEMEIIAEDERRQILAEFNNPAVGYNEEKTVIDYFEISAAKFPDRIAVESVFSHVKTRTEKQEEKKRRREEEKNGGVETLRATSLQYQYQITYHELNNQSNRLAGFLIEKGVLPDTIVGIMMERTVEMIVGILGILKAGGAYLPIDPEYPQERIDYMLKDSNAKILLTDEIKTDCQLSMREPRASHHSTFINHHSHLAYIIYTSGTTGRPKGVLVRHKNLMGYIRSFQEEFKIKETDVVLQQASFTFDVFVEEVYPCLLIGGTLAIPPHHVIRDTALLAEFIAAQKITIIDCAPLLLNELNNRVQTGISNPFKNVRIAISGGDVLKGEYVANLLKTTAVYNTYGPTETTVCSSYHRLTGLEGDNIPIGKPVNNYQVYIVDNYQRLLPVGLVGEIIIGGIGVTAGYLNRPELTAEKFINYRSYGSGRTYIFYKTGDLGKWLPDGSIQFMGRKDRQVKIRGYRIELEEIETRLLAHKDIKEVSVVSIGEKWLCAYFTAWQEKNIKEMREFLARDIPAYMIPAYFVQLQQMPIGAGGKINSKALPKPAEYGLHTGTEYIPPTNEIEKKLVHIWQEFLHHKQIGILDNFFDMGGDSILVNRCIARIREEIQVEISLQKFFQRPFIKTLAEEIMKLEREIFAITPAERSGEIPLSFSQERLWFLQELDAGNVAYFVPRVIRMQGKLNVSLIERTFTEIIHRHEILRTVFPTIEGQPVQRIQPPFPFKIQLLDWSRWDKEEQEKQVSYFLNEEGRRPFNFEHGPLLRVTLLKLKDEEHLFVLTEHHLIHDGWTQGVLLKEFIHIFSAYSEGKKHNLPELPIQYADYAIWQRTYLQGERLKRHLEYWQEKLSGLTPVLELPGDRPRPAVMSGQGALRIFHLSSTLTGQLKEFSRENGVTLFMTMLAMFKTLLYRYTGEEDLCIGTGIANRGYKEMEGMLGMVINTLPLRTHTVGDLPFKEYLNRVKETCLEAYQHQDTPFGKIVEVLQPERNLSYTPLFQVLFSFMDTPTGDLFLPGLELHLEPTHNRSAKFDINVVLVPPGQERNDTNVENDGEILVEWEYNTDIFNPSTIERITGHYIGLLEEIVHHPDVSISNLSMMGPDEIQRLLIEWNNTGTDYPRDKTIHQLFEEQVEKTPDRTALIGAGEREEKKRRREEEKYNQIKYQNQITFRQLNGQSDQLAGMLIEKGVLPDTIMGIMLDRSLEMIIGILGILKSGGAYLPIDPEYPRERINYILRDSSAKLLVTINDNEGEKVGMWEGEKVFLEFIIHHSNHLFFHHSAFSIQHSNLAYVIYTSGTTGQPKGSLIEHRNVVRLMFNDKFPFYFSDGDTWTLFHSFCFDFSVWEMYGALLYGGKLIIVPRMVARDTSEFCELLTREVITVLNQTPSAFYNLIDEALTFSQRKQSLHIKYVIFGGEALNPLKLQGWLEQYPETRLINMFGITETTVHVTYKEIQETDTGTNTNNIGKPIPTLSVYIFDKYLNPVPIGVVGEICVGGKGVCRGYLNRLELTTRKFIDNPYKQGDYLYRSGDIGRFLENGDIEYIGRIDQQVKIRGFRIELGEIENILLKHESIKEAVVIINERDEDKNLIAYIISSLELQETKLREYLREELPDYMIPSHFVRLERIPLTSNGKLDRKALPKPELKAGESYIAPRNEIEQKLVEIWSDILGMDDLHKTQLKTSIGINDNFFQLGGHSLKVTILAARIEKKFNVKIRLTEIFKKPRINELSRYIKNAAECKYKKVEPAEKKEYYMLSSPQRRLHFLQQMDKKGTAYNIPAIWTLAGILNKNKLEEAFMRLIKRHESLRTSFYIINEGAVQKIHDEVEFVIEYKDLAKDILPQHEQIPAFLMNFIRPFDLSKAPLLRVGVINEKGEKGDRHFLTVDMHHITADGVSMNILVKDIMALYQGNDLPELRMQYKDFSEWQNNEKQGESITGQGEYWLKELAGEIPVLELPCDYPRPTIQSFAGRRIPFEINKDTARALKKLALETESTIYMLLLTIYTMFLSKVTNQEEIIVGTPIAGRRYADLETIIGMFVNTLALRNYPLGEKKFTDFLEEVKEKILKAFEHQDFQYEDLVEQLIIDRNTSRNPLFDTMFALQNMDIITVNIPGLKLFPYPYENKTAKFDLSLNAVEAEEKLLFNFEYSTKLFKEETINRFITYFKNIVESVIENKEHRLADFEIITEKEKQRILFEFNDIGAEYPKDKTIHLLFEEQVEKSSDHIALVGADLRVCPNKMMITYHQLNDQSNQLAWSLIEKGILADDIVAIKIERSVEMIIDIFGILKSGAAYLPIDPDYPQERIDYMLKDSNAKIMLGRTEEIGSEEERKSGRAEKDSNLAYVIYTSGSTGNPKGVMINHNSAVNLLLAMQSLYPFTPSDTYLLKTSYIFDVSVTELFGWALGGGKLAILEKNGEKSPLAITEWIECCRVTYINFVPSMFNVFLNHFDNKNIKRLAGLKYIFLAGEALLPEFVHKFQIFRSLIKLENIYGPTENCVYASYYSLADWNCIDNIPIGKPLANIKLYIINKYNHLQPVGVPGELTIAGAGLARGYLNRPELTAEKFIKYRSYGSYRTYISFYKTGDLARWLPDGNIDFLGRIDHQVKIRGFRIELEEIEQKLLSFDGIEASAVIVMNEKEENYLSAYFTAKPEIEIKEIRNYLAKQLPNYMIPSYFNRIESIPLTASGKIDRKALALLGHKTNAEKEYVAPQNEIEKKVAAVWKDVLKINQVGIYDNFFNIGGNSLKLITLSAKLNTALSADIPIAKLFEHVTINAFTRYFTGQESEERSNEKFISKSRKENDKLKQINDDIAIIGMAGRFPGARNIDEFWDNLKNGIESITFMTEDELKKSGLDTDLINDPNFVSSLGGVLEDKDCFDAAFFDYLPSEAIIMDPQIRIFHECVWETLENAGCDPSTYEGAIGIYAGASHSPNWEWLTYVSGKRDIVGNFASEQLTNKDYICTGIAYKLDLKGPAININTACSTSLVAVHMACQAILNGDCDMALAGGISVSMNQSFGYIYQEGMILSPDGHCRAFDADAGGTIGGNGTGAVLLKPFKKALADNDYIHAIIRGTAINNDGIVKAGYTAPSVKGQATIIRAAINNANVKPEDITYVETHGTGTILGDPIEIEALTQAYHTDKKQYCAIGSVKTNIGHLDAAAGIAGLIKTVLALKNKLIPPSLHYKKANPKIDFDSSPFYVNSFLKEWKNENGPRLAGVSSFGIGGTNAHVVLEEAPEIKTENENKNLCLLLLSARTESTLEKITRNLTEYLQKNRDTNLGDVAYTLQLGRKVFEYKRMIMSAEVDNTIAALLSVSTGNVKTFFSKTKNPPIIFMFPGQGAQYVNMGFELYQNVPLFRDQIDLCFKILKPIIGYDLKEILYPVAMDSNDSPGLSSRLNHTEITQPVIFAFEYALAKLLIAWGIKPYAMIGHSIGEYTAACLAGVFSLEDALTLVSARGRLVSQTPGGAMLSVPLLHSELEPLLNRELSLAAINSPSHCVVSGPHEIIDTFEKQLQERGYNTSRLHTSHAFHSNMMEPVLKEFEDLVSRVRLNKPGIPYISNVTGNWITVQDIIEPTYWAAHLRKTVRFAGGLNELLKIQNAIFVEVGPGKTLSTFARQHQEKKSDQAVLNLIKHPKENVSDQYYLLNQLGQLWLYGVKIDWSNFYAGEKRCRIPLPTYPFEKQSYRVDEKSLNKKDLFPPFKHTTKNQERDLTDYFYAPIWKPSIMDVIQKEEMIGKTPMLIFIDSCGIGEQLSNKLKKEGYDIIIVEKGQEFNKIQNRHYQINPTISRDYHVLFNEFYQQDIIPQFIIHLWNVTGGSDDNPTNLTVEKFANDQYMGFYSLIYIIQAIKKQNIGDKSFKITVVSNNIQDITGEESLCPAKATSLGVVIVIPQEFNNIRCTSIDIILPQPGSKQENKLIRQLEKEITAKDTGTIIAYRNNRRWIQTFEPIKLENNREFPSCIKPSGVYLITGGLGNIGLVIAEYLARDFGARLILTGRSGLPVREEWHKWLSTHHNRNNTSLKILKIQGIEKLGGAVLICSADVSDEKQMANVIAQAEKKFGHINGIIHAAGIGVDPSNYYAIEKISTVEAEEQFIPKVHGLLVLEKIFKDRELDFCLVMSSLSSVLGGLGVAVQSAANLFMDAIVKKYAKSYKSRWLSVNWDSWQVGTNREEGSITAEEAEKTLQLILDSEEENQVIVSKTGLKTRINQWIKPNNVTELGNLKQENTPLLRKRPYLSTAYMTYRNQREQVLTSIWEKFFGVESIGIYDDFFELGGDSLKAVTLIARIHKELNKNISMAEFFNHPTIEALAAYISTSETSAYDLIKPIEKKEYYLQSSSQKRLYFLQQLEKDSTAYHISSAWIMEGILDRKKLQDTFVQLLKRHDSFRTSFDLIAEKPVQRINDEVEFEIEYKNSILSTDYTDEDAKNNIVQHFIRSFIRPFDLSKAPLLRVGLVKLAEEKHLFLVDMHHIISDGISILVLVQDFFDLYAGKELPGINLQYKDYAEWQNREKINKKLIAQSEYWKKEYEGEIPLLGLPTDYARPTVQSFEGNQLTFEINNKSTEILIAMAQDTGVTLYILLLSFYTILLSKLSSQEDIVLGIPVAGRRHTDLEKIIGMFVNTLALRNYPNGEKKFMDFLREVKETALNGFENQEYQYEDLIEQISVRRDTGRNPLFDTMFVLQTINSQKIEIPGLKLVPYNLENKTSIFDLTLTVLEGKGKLLFTFEYSIKLFREETINKFIVYFKNIISNVIEDKERKIVDFEIMTEEEKGRILFDFNNTKVEYPKDKTIHQLFAEQALKTPDYTALVGSDLFVCPRLVPPVRAVSLTYRQLNEQSNQLAGSLIEKGVLPDNIIGIMLERSIEMIIAIMGILKSGGAYLPIDPNYPQERIDYMLKDSAAKILIKKSHLQTNPNNQNFVSCLDIRASNLTSSNLAYVIYTSGTTGKPKGVMVQHHSLVNMAISRLKRYRMQENEHALLSASISFDASVEQIFPPLLNGSQLVIVTKEILLASDKFDEVMIKHSINHMDTVPLFLSNIQLKPQYKLKRIAVGADVCSIDLARSWIYYNNFDFYNEYGPTEAAVISIDILVKEINEDLWRKNIPIGKPIANTVVYLLDGRKKLVPIGIVGELYIGGDCVARGYLNCPELTAEKFIKYRSYGSYRTYIFYRTGDLARWLPDNNIDFLGRIDQQVKIRGFRIELEEIENHLLKHKQVKKVVVVAKEDTIGDKFLVAYFISERNITGLELKEHLAKDLPAYMIPSHFVQLEKIPLTPNGKTDHKALPKLELKAGESYIAPRNEIEAKLVEIWSDILGKDESHTSQLKKSIGIDDNFFQLGGHSLKATVLIAKIYKYLNVKLPLSEFFKQPTIERIAQYIKHCTVVLKYSGLTRAEEKEYYELSFAQQRLFILNKTRNVGIVYNLPTAWIIEDNFDIEKLEKTFKALIDRHESLRTSFIVANGKPSQIIHKHVDFRIQILEKDNLEKNPGDLVLYFLKEFVKPFDLSKAPLLRMASLKLEDKKYALFFDMHHIITDGVSQDIFIKDFISVYKEEKLHPLGIQYKDFAEWQKGKEGKEIHAKQEKYWLNKFTHGIPVLKIPTDFPRPDIQSFQGDSIHFTFDQLLNQKLKKMIKESGTTLNMFLLTIYNILLSKYSGQTDIVVGLGIAARTHPDLENIIGFFVNVMPIRTCFEQDMTFEKLLAIVKENTLEAFENQDYPFDELVNKLNITNNLNRNPLFDVSFVTQNMDMKNIEIENLKMIPYPLKTHISHFDMLMYARENENSIAITLEYSTMLFKSVTIRKFADRYREILNQVVDHNGNIKLKDITITHDLAVSKSTVLQTTTDAFGF